MDMRRRTPPAASGPHPRRVGLRALRKTLVLLAVSFSSISIHVSRAVAQEWFDDYARGVAALEDGKPDLAIRHLERAVRRRSDPGSNLVTYGTNRLPEYFPYLKLAEAHLRAGNLEAAREALRLSHSKGKEPAEARGLLQAQVHEADSKAREELERRARADREARATVPSPLSTTTVAPTVAPRETASAPLPRAGKLVVRSEPEGGASVFANGRFLGLTPLSVELDPGEYEVKVLTEGARPERVPVTIVAGETSVVAPRLSPATSRPAPAAGPPPVQPVVERPSLLIVSDPPGTSIYLDDELIGSTDLQTGRLLRASVSAGTHRVRLSRPEHGEVVDDIEIAPKGETRYEARLAPKAAVLEATSTAPSADPPAVGTGAPARGAKIWFLPGFALVLAGIAFALRRRSSRAQESTRLTEMPVALAESGRRKRPEAPSETDTVVAQAERERFGEFRVLKQLGKGGMAAVYLVERGGKLFALKRPLEMILEDDEFRERFLREAEIGRTLHHPNIIRIFDRGEVGGVPYFTMEVVEGETLSKKLERKEVSRAKDAAAIVLHIAEALDYAHLKGVVHRDLKPGNIMISKDETIKVMDYGIARARRFDALTLTGQFLGTPSYTAPEAAEGKPTDARSDLYSLGVIFYEMITGQRPFVSDNPLVTLKKHCSEPPTPPSLIAPTVPRRIEVMILRLMAKSPDDRYQDAEHLLVELRDFLNRDRGAAAEA